jgi:hypothetical protein
MLARLRPRLTYANVVSTLCLFILLGGTAWAVAKNSIGTAQLKNKAVTTPKLADGAVNSAKVANGSLTGVDVNASTLGTVPSATSAGHATIADSATNAGNATNAGTVDGKNASDFLAVDATAGGDLTGGFSNLQLGQNSVGATDIANVQRSVSIPLAAFIDCQTNGGAYLPFTGNLDNADNIARFEVPNQDGSVPYIAFDANATQPDQNFEICSSLSVPPDYASGGSFFVTGVRGSAATAEEDLQCNGSVNQNIFASASVVLDTSSFAKTCTPTFSSPPLTPGASLQFYLSITSPTTMDSFVDLHTVEFAYTAVQ